MIISHPDHDTSDAERSILRLAAIHDTSGMTEHIDAIIAAIDLAASVEEANDTNADPVLARTVLARRLREIASALDLSAAATERNGWPT